MRMSHTEMNLNILIPGGTSAGSLAARAQEALLDPWGGGNADLGGAFARGCGRGVEVCDVDVYDGDATLDVRRGTSQE